MLLGNDKRLYFEERLTDDTELNCQLASGE